MPLLSATNIVKKYGERIALNGVTIELEDGEFVGLVGPNGTGKTTLLRILAGIDEPTSGDIYLNGLHVKSGEELRKACTMIFQRAVMFDGTVYDNVAFGLRVRGCSGARIQEAVGAALSAVGLAGFEKRRANKLSGGEQQRVSIARALALRPRVLLLDEPTSNLDPPSAAVAEQILKDLTHDAGITAVLATHNIAQADRLCRKIALLEAGRLVQFGSTKEVLGGLSEATRRLAAFGNVFAGQAVTAENGLALIRLADGVEIYGVTERRGPVTVQIRPEDVIVSRDPLPTSARNMLRGRIVSMVDQGPSVALGVDAGLRFYVRITRSSFSEMNLGLGSEIFLLFKASAVEVA